MILEWLIGIGIFVVICIVANDMYSRRNSRPLSQMKPKPGTVSKFGWMEDLSRGNPRDDDSNDKGRKDDR